MILLIGGAGHTGKTLFTKMLVEKTRFSALSLDHLKMGLIRAGITKLTPEDDRALTAYLWPIASEMIKTAVENRQDLILEGCYIPGDWASSFTKEYLKEIRGVFLVMTEPYIRAHLGRIQRFARVAEYRLYDRVDREELVRDNAFYAEEAKKGDTPVLWIQNEYDPEALFQELTRTLGLS